MAGQNGGQAGEDGPRGKDRRRVGPADQGAEGEDGDERENGRGVTPKIKGFIYVFCDGIYDSFLSYIFQGILSKGTPHNK